MTTAIGPYKPVIYLSTSCWNSSSYSCRNEPYSSSSIFTM